MRLLRTCDCATVRVAFCFSFLVVQFVIVSFGQVSPRFQGVGLSKKLLQTAINHCTESSLMTKIVLSTTAMQIPAQKLYEKFGFRETRTEKRLVGPLKIATMDFIHYELPLPPK